MTVLENLTVQLLTVNTKDSANPNERPGVHSALKLFVRKLFFKKGFLKSIK